MISRLFPLTCCVALALSGCAAPVTPSSRLGLKLSPASLGESISLQQHFKVERDGRNDELDAALEVDAEHIELVGLALGQRVLTLHFDGKNVQTWRHVMMPSQVRGEDVLDDLQLTLWPADAIRQALPAGWRLEDNGLRRTLLSDDVPVTVIDYSGQPRWSGTVELNNLRYRYRLTIQSVSTAPSMPLSTPLSTLQSTVP